MRRRRRRWPWVLAVIAVLLAAVLGLATWYALSLGRVYDEQRHTVETGPMEEAGSGPMNILLLGSDSRAGEPGESDIGQRSDTMMLVHIPQDRRRVYVMSILRDSWVTIPGHGESKVNAAFDLGGYPLAVQTVEDLLGVPVHHLMEVDFQGFRGVTEALGGVQVCNPTAFSSGQSHPSYYPRGRILLEGTAALRYVRERYAFQDGDLTRVKNQQRYVAGALNRFLSPEILANPARTADVVGVLSQHLSVDDALTSGTIASLAWQMRGLTSADVEMFTVPITGDDEGPNGQSILLLDEVAVGDLRRALQDDDVQSYVDEYEADDEDTADGSEAGESDAAAAPAGLTAPAGPGAPALPVLAALSGSASPSPESAVGEDPCGS